MSTPKEKQALRSNLSKRKPVTDGGIEETSTNLVFKRCSKSF